MARHYTDSNGNVMIIPDSSLNINVVTNPTGLASTGVIALVGEADMGPHWSEETKLADNSFGPGDLALVTSKYGSGRLVDAFRGMLGASNSPRIQGSFQRAILVKTNQSSKASRATADGHGTIQAILAGSKGNQIKETISTSTDEVAPTTGAFSYVPSASASSMAVRVNGAAKQAIAISANMSPAALAAAITAASNLNAVGGVDRVVTSGLSASNSVDVQVSGQSASITLASPAVWGASPVAGDTLHIASGSAIAGAGNANVGWYVVTSASNSTTLAKIVATKVTAGAPVAVSSVSLSATPASDLAVSSSMSISNMSGTDRAALAGLVAQTATISAAGSSLTVTLSGSNVFAASAKIGDLMQIPAGSAFVGAGSANAGWYQVTAVSNFAGAAFVTAARLSNGSPVAVSSTAIAAVSDIQIIAKQIKGSGKSLEIADNAGAVSINTVMLGLASVSAASWLSTALTSAAELKKRIDLAKSSPLVTESFIHGGNIVLKLGYAGTSATATIATVSGAKMLTTSVVGGNGADLSINLSAVSTMADLIDMLNAQAGYSAAIGASADLQKAPTVMDEVSAIGICSDLSSKVGQIKRDIYDMTAGLGAIATSSNLVTYVASAKAGLPEDEGPLFLSGGAKGASTGLNVAQGVDALSAARCNFVVPLMSQDASVDAALGLTDSASTYTVDAVNAAVRSHCLSMSTAKVKRHRQGFVSKKDTFANCKDSAQTMGSYRIAHFFQDVKDLDSNGNIVQFQPWMLSAKAASMQAAGFYKSIFNKAITMSGIVDPSGFDDQLQSACEDALSAGLIPVQKQDDGTFLFLSDQTTYGVDNNFVYNSVQAVYVADTIGLSLADSLKKAFVGESTSDVTPALVVTFIKSKMAEFLGNKLIAATSDFPSGWKSIKVDIAEGVMSVKCVVIEGTSIYFIPVNVDIEGVKDSASA